MLRLGLGVLAITKNTKNKTNEIREAAARINKKPMKLQSALCSYRSTRFATTQHAMQHFATIITSPAPTKTYNKQKTDAHHTTSTYYLIPTPAHLPTCATFDEHPARIAF
jgi:hypothetical protein